MIKEEIKMRKVKKNKDKYMKKVKRKNAIIEAKLKVFKEIFEKKESKAVNAYVMFRSMEGKERALRAYKHGACARFFYSVFCCKCKQYSKKKFFGRWLKVK